MKTPVIEIEGLSHRFADGSPGLEDINLLVNQGEWLVLAGPNGSGKTTLLRHLNGLLRPSSGSVRLLGTPVSENPARARQIVGMVFQNSDNQIVGETVFDDVAFGPENLCLDRKEIEKRVTRALTIVGLTQMSDRRPHTLSGGEKRRLAIAGILAMQSSILVFDEPFANLDYPGVRQVLRQITNLHQAGHTIIVATHDLDKIIAHAQRLVIMQNGRIVRDGPPVALLSEVESFGIREPFASRLGLEVASWLK